jgi:TonB family protein
MTHRRFGLGFKFVGALAIALVSAPASAQDSLQAAKELYASAAYEDALRILSRLQAGELKAEVEQYRVSCLVALGRTREAEKAIEAVVAANPMFVPDGTEVSPRIQNLFARTRKQLLPDIAQKMYTDAKVALDQKDRAVAIAKFGGLVELIDSLDETSVMLSEIRLLASGFLDLSRALPAPKPEPAPAPAPAVANRTAKPPSITPPVALKQSMPAWLPSDNVSRQSSFSGTVRVAISPEGKVASAEIVRSVHPLYDPLLLQAARAWEYQPARSDGMPVASEQLVQVQLKPRQ